MSSIIFGVVCIALCVLPFLYMYYGKNRSKKALETLVSNELNSRSKAVGEFEHCAGFIIGVDKEYSTLVLGRQKNGKKSPLTIDLSNVKQVSSNIIRRNVGVNGNNQVIDKIELVFQKQNSGQDDIKLTLYDAAISFQLYGELELAQKWVDKLNKKMRVLA